MKIKLQKFEKDVEIKTDLATFLEFILVWGESSEDTVSLLRVNSAAIGVALDSFGILPKYRPEKDEIKSYGRKILDRLLQKQVSTEEIYVAGSTILTHMLSKLPSSEEVEQKEDFFCSEDQDK
tara:strand:- start:242 stop:610 length:369 start_codon:yes stop_codon:yes gene_type:complete